MKLTTKLTKKVIPLKRRILYISIFIFTVYFLTCAIPYCSNKARRLTFKGYVEASHHRYGKARDYYNEAIENDPTYEDAYFKRGEVYFKLVEYDKAISDLTKAIELKPDNSEAYLLRGKIYFVLEKYKLSISDFSEVLRLDPDRIDVYSDRGYTYERLDMIEEAIKDYRKGCELGDYYSCSNLESILKDK